MSSRALLRRPWARAVALFVGCTLAGLYFGVQLHMSTTAWGSPASLEWSITVRLWAWYQWGVLALGVWWLGDRFRLDSSGWRTALAVHLLASVAVGAGQIALNTWTHVTFVEPWHVFVNYLRSLFLFAFQRNLLIYWALIGGQLALRAYRGWKEQEVAAAELRSRLVEARLDALRVQLQPHFLFNTLNAITTLVRRDPPRAERMIHDLSDLLRLTLSDDGASGVPLARELEILDRYVEIQRARFGDKLRVRRDVDSAALGLQVPPMILQPIVENAIRYAVAERYEGGTVELTASLHGDRLRIRVRDDGPGLDGVPDASRGRGIGLANTRERLQRLYEEDHEFRIGNVEPGGLEVFIEVPARGDASFRDATSSGPGKEAA